MEFRELPSNSTARTNGPYLLLGNTACNQELVHWIHELHAWISLRVLHQSLGYGGAPHLSSSINLFWWLLILMNVSNIHIYQEQASINL